MKTVVLRDHIDRIQPRRAELGMPEDDSALRNPGTGRTPEKVALLQSIASRARSAGHEPVAAHYPGARYPGFSLIFDRILQATQNGGVPTAWTSFEGLDICLRLGERHLESCGAVRCLQVANIETREDMSGQGMLTRFVQAVEAVTDMPIYVEGVLTPRLAASLERRGFTRLGCSADLPSDYVRLVQPGAQCR